MKKNNSVQDKKMIVKQLQQNHQKLFDDFEVFSKELTAWLRQELAENPVLIDNTRQDENHVKSELIGEPNDGNSDDDDDSDYTELDEDDLDSDYWEPEDFMRD